ncbi:MAG: OmpA family protein [Deltaproteobacteria bacterium]|nr:OmpA family protein [Deltaproteobacteria bacterium]
MKKIFSLAMILVFAAACATTDPYTGEKKTSNTAKGAGVGAVTGAVLGAVIGGDTKGALVGAAAGAALGAGAGHYMDNQEAKMREQLQGTGVSVTRVGDNIRLNMPGNITFSTNSPSVQGSFYPVLNSVAEVLKEFDKTAVHVTGFTDSTGGDAYNQELSEGRAGSVSQYLKGQAISPARLHTNGMGERNPIADNSTTDGRQANRRVEITVIPQ